MHKCDERMRRSAFPQSLLTPPVNHCKFTSLQLHQQTIARFQSDEITVLLTWWYYLVFALVMFQCGVCCLIRKIYVVTFFRNRKKLLDWLLFRKSICFANQTNQTVFFWWDDIRWQLKRKNDHKPCGMKKTRVRVYKQKNKLPSIPEISSFTVNPVRGRQRVGENQRLGDRTWRPTSLTC